MNETFEQQLETVRRARFTLVLLVTTEHDCRVNALVRRKLRTLAQRLKFTRKSLVVLTPTGKLPDELCDESVRIAFDLPRPADLEAILDRLCRVPGVKVELTPDGRERLIPANYDLESLARRGEGFDGSELEQAVIEAMSSGFNANRAFTTDDIKTGLQRLVPLSVSSREPVAALRRWLHEGRAQSASFIEKGEAERNFVPFLAEGLGAAAK